MTAPTVYYVNTPQISISGTVDVGDAGTTVSLVDGDEAIGSAIVENNGSWSATVTLQGDGDHLIKATDTDAAGNVGASSVVDYRLDTVAPVVSFGNLSTLYNTENPTLSGTIDAADAGDIINIYDGSMLVGSVASNSDGSWSTQVALYYQGENQLTATATDIAGNVSSPAYADIFVDSIPPQLFILSAGGLTSKATQTITGAIDLQDVNLPVSIYAGSLLLATTQADPDGDWSATVTFPGDGVYTVTAQATDEAGNVGATSVVYTVDSTAPTVTITSAGGLTNQPSQTITGTIDSAHTGLAVSILEGDNVLAVATPAADGTWSANVTLVGDGFHTLVAEATTASGVTATSGQDLLLLDTHVPNVTISSIGGLTNDPSQTITGTIDPSDYGLPISVYDGATLLGTVSTFSGGWSLAVTLTGDGVHSLVAKATDAAGTTDASPPLTLTLDTAPPMLAITSAGGLTNKTQQTLSGTIDTADANATVSIYDGASLLGTVAPAANGGWSLGITLSGDGAHTLIAKATDAAGNTGVSASIAFTLDTTPPVAPGVSLTADTGSSSSDDITSVGTVAVSGIETGATVQYSIDGGNTWTSTFTAAPGANTVVVRQIDAAGNISKPSTPLVFTLDTVAPTIAIDSVGTLSANTVQTIFGTIGPADAGVPIYIFDGSTQIGEATAGANGAWSIDVDINGDGAHSLVAKATDLAGNVGVSNTETLTLDTQKPTLLGITPLGAADQLAGSTLQFSVAFSKPVVGVDASAFRLSGTDSSASITGVSGSGATYTVTVNPGAATSGTVELDIAGAKIRDLAGNPFDAVYSAQSISSATVGSDPYAVAVADLNGDGRQDIITTNLLGSSVSVLLGRGDGTFASALSSATGPGPDAIAVGDLNGDGKADIIVSNTQAIGNPSLVGDTVSVLLGKGDGTFGAATNYVVGTDPSAIAIADVNGDGKPDMIVANAFDGTISVLLGNGAGGFGPATTIAVGNTPVSLAVADLNGDGKPDIVVANASDNTVSILTNRGNGQFNAATNLAVGEEPQKVILADLSGDGKIDIVTANGDGTVSVLLGNGNGSFAPRVDYEISAGGLVELIALADVNGDGKLDIVATSYTSSGNVVTALLGNGDGTFSGVETVSAGGAGPANSIAVADVNGDGRSDVVLPNESPSGQVQISLNSPATLSGPAYTLFPGPTLGAPVLSSASHSGAAGDGITNVTAPTFTVALTFGVSAGQIIQLLLNGAALAHPVSHTVTSADLAAGYVTLAVNAGDLGADGPKSISARLTSPARRSPPARRFRYARYDTAEPRDHDPKRTHQQRRTDRHGTIDVADAGDRVALRRLDVACNGDGACGWNLVGGHRTDGTGTPFHSRNGDRRRGQHGGERPRFPRSRNGRADGDAFACGRRQRGGRRDAAIRCDFFGKRDRRRRRRFRADRLRHRCDDLECLRERRQLRRHRQPGPGGRNRWAEPDGRENSRSRWERVQLFFAPPVAYEVGAAPEAIALGDLNGDGKTDMVVANAEDSSFSVLMGGGNGTFSSQTQYAAHGTAPDSIDLADLNGDGKKDIVVANAGSNSVSVFLNNGVGQFTLRSAFVVGDLPTSVAIGDIDGDGRPDMVVANAGDNTVSVLHGNGDGTFQLVSTLNVGHSPEYVTLADVNGDGKLDLIVADSGDNSVSVLLGNGNGTFGPAQTYAVGGSPNSIAVADVNGDGRPDLVVADNGGSAGVSVLLGNGDGTFKPATDYLGASVLSVAVADVNGDGKPDIVAAGDGFTSLLLGDGDGTFSGATTLQTGASYPGPVAIADLNGDGRDDVLVGDSQIDGNVDVLLGSPAIEAGPSYLIVGPPTAATPVLTAASDSGVSGDNLTNNSAPSFSIAFISSVVAGDTVQLLLAGAPLAHPATHVVTAADVAAGSVTLGVSAGDLGSDGVKQISAQVSNSLGQVTTSQSLAITLDTTPPTLAITSSGGLTNKATQTIAGTIDAADAGLTVSLYDGSTLLGTANANANGVWSKSVTLSGDGPHQIVAEATDAAGNLGESSALALTLDTTPPTLTIGSQGGLTNQKSQTIDGTIDAADANLTVSLYDGTTLLGTTTANTSGAWSTGVTLSGDGAHVIVAKATDAAGNTGTSAGLGFTLDTTPPTLTIVSAPTLTNNATPTISGAIDAADANLAVTIYDGATAIATVTPQSNGAWSAALSLSEGSHSLVAKATDAAGNLGASTAVAVTVDLTPPTVAITSPGGLTDSAAQTVTGTIDAADVGRTVSIYDGVTLLGSVTTTSVDWSVPVTLSADGSHSLVAKATDLAGNVGTSGAVVFTLDNQPPVLTITSGAKLTNQTTLTITGTIDAADANLQVSIYDGSKVVATATPSLVDGTWSAAVTLTGDGLHDLVAKAQDAAGNIGSSGLDAITLDTTPPTLAITSSGGLTNKLAQTIAGTIDAADAGLTVSLYDGSTLLGTASANASGVWSKSVTLSGDGSHQIVAEATDAAGNLGESSALALTLDTTPPTLTIGSQGGLTNQKSQTIAGTIDAADANLTVSLYDGTTLLGTTTANTSGAWSTGVTLSGDGAHVIVAKATDAAGNTGTSAGLGFTLDTTPPTLTIVSAPALTNNATPTISGAIDTADANLVVTIYDGGTAIATVTPQSNGAWSAALSLSEGSHSLVAKATDAAGNLGASAAAAVTVDTSIPSPPTLALQSDTGASSSDGVTSDGALSLSGVLLGATVQYSTDGGKTWVNGFTAVQGANTVIARQINAAGSVSSASSPLSFVLDTIAPATPGLALAQDTGSSASDRITSNPSLVTSNVEANAKVEYSTDGGQTWSTTFVPEQGVNSVSVRQTDLAGNVSPVSAPFVFTYDNVPPAVTITSAGGLTNKPNETITGTIDAADAGLAITLYDGTALVATTQANASGVWSANVNLSGDGAHTLVAEATDATGNTGESESDVLTLDSTPPTATIALAAPATETEGTTVQFDVTFSEPVTGVDLSAFSLANSSDAGATITGFTGSGANYVVSVNPGSGTGSVELDLTGTKIADLAGNAFASGSLQAAQSYSTGMYNYTIDLGDVNGDGKLDLVTAGYNYYISGYSSYYGTYYPVYTYFYDYTVQLGNGAGGLGAPATYSLPFGWTNSIRLADVNGDGRADLVVVNSWDASVSVALSNGQGGIWAFFDLCDRI